MLSPKASRLQTHTNVLGIFFSNLRVITRTIRVPSINCYASNIWPWHQPLKLTMALTTNKQTDRQMENQGRWSNGSAVKAQTSSPCFVVDNNMCWVIEPNIIEAKRKNKKTKKSLKEQKRIFTDNYNTCLYSLLSRMTEKYYEQKWKKRFQGQEDWSPSLSALSIKKK